MTITMYGYKKCSTCQKAKKWVESQGFDVEFIDFVVNKQSKATIQSWVDASSLPMRRFFNTSGIKYREMQLSQKLDGMSNKEMLELLASDGMLVKRPVITYNGKAYPGFREVEWSQILGIM